MIRKWDIILIAVLLILSCAPAGIFFLCGQHNDAKGIQAVVYVNGQEYKTIPLSEHHGTDSFTIQTDQGYNTIVIRDQSIAISEADCPDRLCVKEGFLSQPGQTSVCLPHKVMIEIRAVDASDPDIIRAR